MVELLDCFLKRPVNANRFQGGIETLYISDTDDVRSYLFKLGEQFHWMPVLLAFPENYIETFSRRAYSFLHVQVQSALTVALQSLVNHGKYVTYVDFS